MNEFYAGQEIWIVERDEDGVAYEVSGVVFIAKVDGRQNVYAIVSPYIEDSSDIDYIMEDAMEDDYTSDFMVILFEDCYITKEEAESALKEEN